MKFRADAVHIERTPVHVILGFATEGETPRRHVLMMRTLDDEDAPGHVLTSEPYLEVNGPETSGYGCVAAVTLGAGHIEIQCNRRRCPRLPDEACQIDFGPAVRARWQEIHDSLGAIIDAPRLVVID